MPPAEHSLRTSNQPAAAGRTVRHCTLERAAAAGTQSAPSRYTQRCLPGTECESTRRAGAQQHVGSVGCAAVRRGQGNGASAKIKCLAETARRRPRQFHISVRAAAEGQRCQVIPANVEPCFLASYFVIQVHLLPRQRRGADRLRMPRCGRQATTRAATVRSNFGIWQPNTPPRQCQLCTECQGCGGREVQGSKGRWQKRHAWHLELYAWTYTGVVNWTANILMVLSRGCAVRGCCEECDE
jgi:hypothetical protein